VAERARIQVCDRVTVQRGVGYRNVWRQLIFDRGEIDRQTPGAAHETANAAGAVRAA
jgi:hypothetical protein